MNKTQRVIVILLVLAVVFSAFAVFVSFAGLNLDIDLTPKSRVVDPDSGTSADIGFFVENSAAGKDGVG